MATYPWEHDEDESFHTPTFPFLYLSLVEQPLVELVEDYLTDPKNWWVDNTGKARISWIPAIREVRQRTHWSLPDSRDFVYKVAAELNGKDYNFWKAASA